MKHKLPKIPPKLRPLKRKIEAIYNLEKDYWKTVSERHGLLENVLPEVQSELEEIFPKEVSSRIFVGKDGIIILRYSDPAGQVSLDFNFSHYPIRKILADVPIPKGNSYEHLGVSIIPNVLFDISNTGINERTIGKIFRLTSFMFNNLDEKTGEWQDAINDFKYYLLGLNSIPRPDIGNKNQTEFKDSVIKNLKELRNAFQEKLKSAKVEEELQIFLKENPILLGPHSNLYPKKKLGEDFITDFVLVNIIDQGYRYTFVELEKVSMNIFTKKGEFTKEFNHAYGQIIDWEGWITKNKDYLAKKLVGLESPYYLIVAGRSLSFDENQKERLRAWGRLQRNADFLTYDDLLKQFSEFIETIERNKDTQ